MRLAFVFALICCGLVLGAAVSSAQSPSAPVWSFAVSGDSRNCGDVVMPAIAAGVKKDGAKFYWHLGDYRAIYDFDEDMVAPACLHLSQPHTTIISYLSDAWPNFIRNQLVPFGEMELFLGKGNHETIPPKKESDYLQQFENYLDSPAIRAQREKDHDTAGGVRSYYHWIMGGVDFITLDNATNSSFSPEEMKWIRARLAEDKNSKAVSTVVVGMH